MEGSFVNLMSGAAGRLPHTSFAGKALRFPLRLVPRNVVVPVLGGINRGMRWITGAGTTNGCWLGTYEQDHVSALEKIIRPGMVAYDVGANAGYYTLALSRLVGKAGRVYSFEPDARNAHLLRRHVELNQLQNVVFVQAAVSEGIGLVPFTGWELVDSSSYIVPSISLDSFIAEGNPIPDFIKMDIEGAEAAALRGATNLLSKRQTTWIVATHTDELTRICKATLAEYGYRFTGFDCLSDPGNAADFMAFLK